MQKRLHFLYGLLAGSACLLAFRRRHITPGVEWNLCPGTLPPGDRPASGRLHRLPVFSAFTTGRSSKKWLLAQSGVSSLSSFSMSVRSRSVDVSILIEPSLRLAHGLVWCAGYSLYVGVAFFLPLRLLSGRLLQRKSLMLSPAQNLATGFVCSGLACLLRPVMCSPPPTSFPTRVAWISVSLVSPLCLTSAPSSFASRARAGTRRSVFQPLFWCWAGLTCWCLFQARSSVWLQLIVYSALLFVSCMIATVELVRIKPVAQHLTHFYVLVSLGGALGGIFTGLLAPTFSPTLGNFILASLPLPSGLLVPWPMTGILVASNASLSLALLASVVVLAIPVLLCIFLLQEISTSLRAHCQSHCIGLDTALRSLFSEACRTQPSILNALPPDRSLSPTLALFVDVNFKAEDIRRAPGISTH